MSRSIMARTLLLIMAIAFVSGCVTTAQQEAQDFNAKYQIAASNMNRLKFDAERANPEFYALRREIGLTNDAPTFSQKMNDQTLSYNDAEVLLEGLNAAYPFREQAIQIEASMFPYHMQSTVIQSGRVFMAQVDEMYMQLLRRQITKGEAAQMRQSIYMDYQRRYSELMQEYNASLQLQHQAQLQRQQQALNAFQNAYYNERYLAQMNKPWYTNCQSTGSNISCTTY